MRSLFFYFTQIRLSNFTFFNCLFWRLKCGLIVLMRFLSLRIVSGSIFFEKWTIFVLGWFIVERKDYRRLIFFKSIREIVRVDWTEILRFCLCEVLKDVSGCLEIINQDGWGWAGCAQLAIFEHIHQIKIVISIGLNDFVQFIKLRVDFMNGRMYIGI